MTRPRHVIELRPETVNEIVALATEDPVLAMLETFRAMGAPIDTADEIHPGDWVLTPDQWLLIGQAMATWDILHRSDAGALLLWMNKGPSSTEPT